MNSLLWTSGLLLAAAWLSPLHVLPWVSWHNEVLGLLAVLVACAGALWLARRGRQGVWVPSLAVLPLVVLLAALLQWLAGRIVYTGSVLAIACYVLLCVASAILGHAAARAESAQPAPGPSGALRILALVLVGVGLLQVFIVFSQCFYLWSGSDWIARTAYETRGGGNVAQPNQAAQLFLLATAATVYLLQARRIGAATCTGLLLLLALGLATTQSRSGVLGLLVLSAWLLVRRSALPRPIAVAPVVAYFALVLVLFLAWPPFASGYWALEHQSVNLTTSGRTAMWAQLLEAVALRPWFGWGVMQVAEAQNSIAHAHAAIHAATFSHNLFLDIALWLGVPALLLVLALVTRWLWPRVAAARSLETWFCIAIVLPFAVQSLTEFPYAYSYFLAPVFFALGMLDAWSGRPGAGWRVPRPLAAGVFTAWVGVTGWSLVEYVQIEEDFRVARFETLRVGATPVAYEVPQVHVLTQLDALLRATRLEARPGLTTDELALLRDVALLHPWGATNFRYAVALALNGKLEEAHRQLLVLRAMHTPASFERLMLVVDEMAGKYPVLKQLQQP